MINKLSDLSPTLVHSNVVKTVHTDNEHYHSMKTTSFSIAVAIELHHVFLDPGQEMRDLGEHTRESLALSVAPRNDTHDVEKALFVAAHQRTT